MYTPIKSWTKRDRVISKEGYVLVKVPEHPKNFKGWYYEHRLVIEKQLNRINCIALCRTLNINHPEKYLC